MQQISQQSEQILSTLERIRKRFESWTPEYKLMCDIINEKSAVALKEIETPDTGAVVQSSENTLTDRLYGELVDEKKKVARLENEVLALQTLFKSNEEAVNEKV